LEFSVHFQHKYGYIRDERVVVLVANVTYQRLYSDCCFWGAVYN